MGHDRAISNSTATDHHLIHFTLDPSTRRPDCFRRPHAAGRKQILDRQSLLLLNHDEFVDEGRAELFPPRRFRRPLREKGMRQKLAEQPGIDLTSKSKLAVSIHRMAPAGDSAD